MPKVDRILLSTHSEWLEIYKNYNERDYREFLKIYQFDPKIRIYRTGRPLEEVVIRRTQDQYRERIAGEALLDGLTVEEANAKAKAIHSTAPRDGDIFIFLHRGFIRLEDTPSQSISVHEKPTPIECTITRSTLFLNNQSQAVRLSRQVAFPEDVHQVEIIKIGHSRVISPVGRRWNDLFQNGPHASDDFMSKPIDLPAEVRESL